LADRIYLNELKNQKLKATPKRLAILKVLSAATVYLGPQEVWEQLKKDFKKLGLPTVYRNLEELVDAGLVSRIIHPNRRLYYFLCENHQHHHHFICVQCGKVQDIGFCAQDQLQKEVAHLHGGKILSHTLQVNGLCRSCLNS
jgi:Fur family transcriptional regulator, ferric uptake regulator